MIRINLLGTAKPKKGRKSRRLFAMPTLTTEGPSPLIAGLALLVVAAAGIYFYHMRLENTHEKLQSDLTAANRSIASMVKVKQAYLERQKEYDAFKRRFDIIDQLRQGQVGPVPLLTNLSETVNKTEGVWLLSMHDDGATVSLDGLALGPNNVANLMTNLRNSGYYKNVELRDTVQEDNQKSQTFSFSMVCEKTKV
jgi:type IV pilus assembly protein PilN